MTEIPLLGMHLKHKFNSHSFSHMHRLTRYGGLGGTRLTRQSACQGVAAWGSRGTAREGFKGFLGTSLKMNYFHQNFKKLSKFWISQFVLRKLIRKFQRLGKFSQSRINLNKILEDFDKLGLKI